MYQPLKLEFNILMSIKRVSHLHMNMSFLSSAEIFQKHAAHLDVCGWNRRDTAKRQGSLFHCNKFTNTTS